MSLRLFALLCVMTLLNFVSSPAHSANGFPEIDTANLPYGISEADWKNRPTHLLVQDFRTALAANDISIAQICRPHLFSGYSKRNISINYVWPDFKASDVLCLMSYAKLYEDQHAQGRNEPLKHDETGGFEISAADLREVANKLQKSFDVRAQYELGRMLLTGAYPVKENDVFKDHSFWIGVGLRQAEKLGSELAGSANSEFTASQNFKRQASQEAERKARIARGEPETMGMATMAQAERFCRDESNMFACQRMISLAITKGETSSFLSSAVKKLDKECSQPSGLTKPLSQNCRALGDALRAGVGARVDLTAALKAFRIGCTSEKFEISLLQNHLKIAKSGQARLDISWARACEMADKTDAEIQAQLRLRAAQRAADQKKQEQSALAASKSRCDALGVTECYSLAVKTADGSGMTRNYAEAARLFKLTCDRGEYRGCSYLGWLHERGNGLSRNYTEAARYYKMACDQKNANGCGNLGWLNEAGLGMQVNYSQAIRLYKFACDGGDGHFCNNLGLMYAKGMGVPRSHSDARRLFRIACDLGETEGCRNIPKLNTPSYTPQQPCIPTVDPGVPGSRRCL